MIRLLVGDCLDCLRDIPEASVHCVVTSPPYWGLRAYTGEPGMIGLEPTFEAHIENLVTVFRAVRRVLRSDGTLWLNYADQYASGPGRKRVVTGLPVKSLMMMPARVALALQADGWLLRSEIVWHKPNAMPESVQDRPSCAHEKVFLFAKSARYFYDADAVRTAGNGRTDRRTERVGAVSPAQAAADLQAGYGPRHAGFNARWAAGSRPGATLRNVWRIATRAYKGAHFATFPPDLVRPCIKAGAPANGLVLDPFAGSGTVGKVAVALNRSAVLIEISPDYADLIERRLKPLSFLTGFTREEYRGGRK